jgi:hypothetical protein
VNDGALKVELPYSVLGKQTLRDIGAESVGYSSQFLLAGLAAGERFAGSGHYNFVSVAEAVVGGPLTPVSVAGVARRTARRCAAGVYSC